MSLATLIARVAAGETPAEIMANPGRTPPATSATSRNAAPVSVKPAPVLACTSETSATAQNDNPQSEPRLAPSDAVAHFRLPNGTELWLSPPETLEQVQSRHPGAVPWTDADSVTVTELLPENEATIRAWLVSLGEPLAAIEQDIETARRFPDTAAWLLARAHIDVTARAIPHTCGDCQRFTHDPEGGGGIGTCAITKAGYPPKDATGYPLCYPFTQRRCPDFKPKEATQ